MIGEHDRKLGYLDAYKALSLRVKADMDAKRGEIKPPRVRWAYYDFSIVSLASKLRIVRSA